MVTQTEICIFLKKNKGIWYNKFTLQAGLGISNAGNLPHKMKKIGSLSGYELRKYPKYPPLTSVCEYQVRKC